MYPCSLVSVRFAYSGGNIVVVGLHDLRKTSPPARAIDMEMLIVHEQYSDHTMDNDIMLIKLR